MRPLDIAVYVEYVMPTLRPEELSGITEENDPLGIWCGQTNSTTTVQSQDHLPHAENGKADVE
jgi:hypothetical protein